LIESGQAIAHFVPKRFRSQRASFVLASRYRQIIGLVALAMWIASLALPVETDCGFSYANQGYLILATGWLGAMVLQLGWFANPFMLWVMGRLMFNRRPGIIPALIGLSFALDALAWKTTPTDNGYNTICARHAGFYVWIACAVLLAVVALIELIRHRAAKPVGGTS
jgi:hypothetical protein